MLLFQHVMTKECWNFALNPGPKQLEFMTSSKIKAPYEAMAMKTASV
jgi:hypothetical protein